MADGRACFMRDFTISEVVIKTQVADASLQTLTAVQGRTEPAYQVSMKNVS